MPNYLSFSLAVYIMSKVGLKGKGSKGTTPSPVLILLKYLNLFLSGEGAI